VASEIPQLSLSAKTVEHYVSKNGREALRPFPGPTGGKSRVEEPARASPPATGKQRTGSIPDTRER
jgi:hypothetical protein